MKSQTRAGIVLAVLLFAWSTPLAAPFRYFATMIRTGAEFLAGLTRASDALAAWLTYLIVAIIVALLFWIGKSRQRLYIAGFASLSEVIYHLWICIENNRVYDVSLPITIGLALALLFLLIPARSPGLWLSDAFIVSLPALIIVEGFFTGLFSALDWPYDLLGPMLIVPSGSLAQNLAGWLSLPMLIWSVLLVILALLPQILLSQGRTKG
ncbi:MAG: hypothetical protein EOM08_07480 [Clostridia bacterium]|nr:hypothetical protein [Clostridia bacterium]NCC76257.1 hypothetical protein [Clostridia bacterium]